MILQKKDMFQTFQMIMSNDENIINDWFKNLSENLSGQAVPKSQACKMEILIIPIKPKIFSLRLLDRYAERSILEVNRRQKIPWFDKVFDQINVLPFEMNLLQKFFKGLENMTGQRSSVFLGTKNIVLYAEAYEAPGQ